MNGNVRKVFIISIVTSFALTALIALLGPALQTIEHPVDTGASWYYWQISNPTRITRLSAWIGYALHQITIWILLFKAKKEKIHPNTVSRLNIIVLITNLFFILLHLVQTHFFYDGLAQDVPIWTSQGSVIVMLILLLVMLTPRRGFILGIKIKINKKGMQFLHGFHGMFISWAIVYTFWFHPMEGEYGLLSGFLYMFFLFIQISMFNTRLHFNMKWVGFLESFVAIHGTLITLQKNNPIWPMFLTGFLCMFSFTYIFGMTKKRSIHILALLTYIITVMSLYYMRGFNHLYEITFIPTALYGGALFLLLLVKIFTKEKSLIKE